MHFLLNAGERETFIRPGSRMNKTLLPPSPMFAQVEFPFLFYALKVWILPGSLFKSDRWLDRLLEEISESRGMMSRTCRKGFTTKDLMAVIEGHFFLLPHPHPINITSSSNGGIHFQSFPVSHRFRFLFTRPDRPFHFYSKWIMIATFGFGYPLTRFHSIWKAYYQLAV